MAFLTDKEELKPGLVIFRRGDVQHRNWYCRVKLPKTDRYKTISLKTADVASARDRAYDHDAVRGTRIVFYNSANAPRMNGCKLRCFETTTRTNWHYECANAFIAGSINI